MKMPTNKSRKPKTLPKDFYQAQGTTSWAYEPHSPQRDSSHPNLPIIGNNSHASLRELLLDIEKKLDEKLEILTAFDGRMVALSVHMERLERLINRLALPAIQTDSSIEKQGVKTQIWDQTLEQLIRQNRHLHARLELLESQAQAHTFRVLGLPEKEEGRDLEAFLEKWLPSILQLDTLENPIIVERAWRVTSRKWKPGPEQCRTVIARVADIRDKERILQRARRLKNIMYKKKQILIVPDLAYISQGKG